MQSRKFLGGQGDRLSEFSGTYIPTSPSTSLPPITTVRTPSQASSTTPPHIAAVSTGNQKCTPINDVHHELKDKFQNAHDIIRVDPCIPEMTIEQHSAAHETSTANAMASMKRKRKVTFKSIEPLPTPKTKTGHSLLRKAAKNAASFTGKYLFGGSNIPSAVLPLPLPPLPTHRDELFSPGELTVAPV